MKAGIPVVAILATLGLSTPAFGSLVTSFQIIGNVGAEVAAYATAGSPGAGVLTLSTIPVGATIEQAYLYTDNYFSGPLTSVTFGGNPLGPSGPFAVDGGDNAYRFDVTSLITGNGNYAASYSGPDNSYGLALAVVYSDPSLPFGTVCINDGAVDMAATTNSSTTRCSGLIAGPGTLWIHTEADNALGQSDDSILYNGIQVAAPIDANLGSFASLFRIAVTNLAGANAATVNSPSDQFAWDLAVFTGGAVAQVPEPATLSLLGLGLAGLGFSRRRKPN